MMEQQAHITRHRVDNSLKGQMLDLRWLAQRLALDPGGDQYWRAVRGLVRAHREFRKVKILCLPSDRSMLDDDFLGTLRRDGWRIKSSKLVDEGLLVQLDKAKQVERSRPRIPRLTSVDVHILDVEHVGPARARYRKKTRGKRSAWKQAKVRSPNRSIARIEVLATAVRRARGGSIALRLRDNLDKLLLEQWRVSDTLLDHAHRSLLAHHRWRRSACGGWMLGRPIRSERSR